MAVPKFTFVKYKNKDITALAKKLAGSLDKDVATLKSIKAAAKSAPLSENLLKDLKLQIAKYIEALVEQEGSDTDSDLDAFVHKARKNKKKEYTTFATGILCRIFFSLSLSIDISICQTVSSEDSNCHFHHFNNFDICVLSQSYTQIPKVHLGIGTFRFIFGKHGEFKHWQ